MNSTKFFIFLFLIALSLVSCEKEIETLSELQNSNSSELEMRNDIPSGPGETTLGQELNNPYDLANVNAAYELLRNEPGDLPITHYYLKLLPTSGAHMAAIEEYEEDYDYEFDLQPIHYEVTYEGDEEYVDPAVGDGGFAPEYGAIGAKHYLLGLVPNVPYEVLNEMHIPKYESHLTFTAFVLSGNEQYYEAIDGSCHPDCPTWPECLDDPGLVCDIDPVGLASLETIDKQKFNQRENFPAYIKDSKMGYYGTEPVLSPLIPDPIVCPPGCIALLRPTNTPPFFLEWYCECDPDEEEEEEGNDPPAGQVEECGCFVYDDPKKPGGKISVIDTQTGEEGVQRVKVKTTRRHWGFIWRNTDTDDEGCWKINRRYNVDRMKTKIVFKDRISDRVVIRSTRGMRVWNAFLKPVKHNWRITRNDRVFNNLCLTLEDQTDNTSRLEQSFTAATVNNAVHEFYEYSDFPDPGRISLMINTISPALIAAPMFRKIDQQSFNSNEIASWLISFSNPFTAILYTYWEFSKADVYIPFGEDQASDDIKENVYHEMAHTAQYAVTGPDWWSTYASYLITRPLAFSQPQPYGDGSATNAGMAELAEGMAFPVGRYMTDLTYGLNHSNGGVAATNTHVNIAERYSFWETNFNFIPRGIFFDLFDENGVFPSSVTSSEFTGITDNVNNFSFETQLNAFGPFIFDIEDFKDELWQQSGPASGNAQSDYNQLFQSYGH